MEAASNLEHIKNNWVNSGGHRILTTKEKIDEFKTTEILNVSYLPRFVIFIAVSHASAMATASLNARTACPA